MTTTINTPEPVAWMNPANNAEAIAELIEAAEEVIEWAEIDRNEDSFIVRLGSALAKIKE